MGIFYNAKKERIKKSVEACLKDETRVLILKQIMETPGIAADRISGPADIIRKLMDEGIIIEEPEGEERRYYVTPEVRALLIGHMPLHYQCPGLRKE